MQLISNQLKKFQTLQQTFKTKLFPSTDEILRHSVTKNPQLNWKFKFLNVYALKKIEARHFLRITVLKE